MIYNYRPGKWKYEFQFKKIIYRKAGFSSKEAALEALEERKIMMKSMPSDLVDPFMSKVSKEKISQSNKTQIGDRTEGVILATLLALGKTVLLPFGNGHRYDMVIKVEDEYLRIQCKTGHLNKSGTAVVFNSSSLNHGSKIRRDYMDDADYFAVYCPQTADVYIIPVQIAQKRVTNIYLSAPNNGIYGRNFEVAKFTMKRQKSQKSL